MKYSHDNDARLKEYYHNDCFRGVGVFSLREIKDGEELFMDYLFSKISIFLRCSATNNSDLSINPLQKLVIDFIQHLF